MISQVHRGFPHLSLYSINYLNASTSFVELYLLQGGIPIFNCVLSPASDMHIQLPFHLPLAIANADWQLTTQWSEDIVASVKITLNLVKDGILYQQYYTLWSPLALFQDDCSKQSTDELVARFLHEPKECYREVIQEILNARVNT